MSRLVPENSKNCQNHGLFEGAVIERRIYQTRLFWSKIVIVLFQNLWNLKIVKLNY